MKMIVLLGIAACCMSVSAVAGEANRMIGVWEWKPTRGHCPEQHEYRANGTLRIRSGDEVLEKIYAVEEVKNGQFYVTTEVVSSNGEKDCVGHHTKVGSKSKTFIQFQNYGGYLTCDSEDGMSCYGSASPATEKR